MRQFGDILKGARILFLLVMVLFKISAEAENAAAIEEKKYNLAICAIFKNEAQFLKEWIEYHRLAGVDHFYLYNNESEDQFLKVLRPYMQENVVTLVQWPDLLPDQEGEENAFKWALSTQVSAYENAIHTKAKQEAKWLVFLEVDEFIVPNSNNTLKQLLEKYESSPGIEISTEFFDAFDVNRIAKKLMIETVELTVPPEQKAQKKVAKMIFKPDQYIGFSWYPYKCHFRDNQVAATVTKQEAGINRYLNRSNQWQHYFGKRKDKLDVDNRKLSEEQTAELLQQGYAIEDQHRAIHRFVPILLKKLEFAP